MTHAWPVCASQVFLSTVLTLCLPPAHTQIGVATSPEYEDCNQEAFAFLGIISDICPAQQLAIRRGSSSTAASVPETAFIYRPQECHSSGQQSNVDNMTHAWPVCASQVFLSTVLTLCLPPAHTQIGVATSPEYEDCNKEAFAFLGIISDICPAQQLAIRQGSSSTAASVPETAFIYRPQECHSSGQQRNVDNMTHAWPVCASQVYDKHFEMYVDMDDESVIRDRAKLLIKDTVQYRIVDVLNVEEAAPSSVFESERTVHVLPNMPLDVKLSMERHQQNPEATYVFPKVTYTGSSIFDATMFIVRL
ncbi:hypothetical protein MTO96_038092 [Rhipicephalus appendiculatus]